MMHLALYIYVWFSYDTVGFIWYYLVQLVHDYSLVVTLTPLFTILAF